MDVAGQAHRVLLLDDILSRAQIDLKTKPIGQALPDRRRISVVSAVVRDIRRMGKEKYWKEYE